MKNITAEQLKLEFIKPNTKFIDVRTKEEYEQGHIENSENLVLQEIQSWGSKLDSSKEYVMICRSGNRSGLACEMLESAGFKCFNLEGGVISWVQKGNKLVK